MPTTDKLKTRDIDDYPPRHYPFWFGGSASCFAAVVTHPLDLSMLKPHMKYMEQANTLSHLFICANISYSQGRILNPLQWR